jgi:hypothetical protein
MFRGNYSFFEYKYNIPGYHGQDFGGFPQYLYLIISFVLLVILLVLLRKSSKEKVLKIVKMTGIFLILFYLGKTIWESYYDIKINGSFNWYILPFDTCSIIMLATMFAGFGKGKIKKIGECWLCTGGIVGGIATMVHLNAFNFYPFLSFGGFYSMLWHFLMVFLGLLLIVTNYVEMKYSTIIYGFLFQVIVSIFVIPINYIYNFDFMLYKDLGGIPFFENLASKLSYSGMGYFNPLIMLILYFITFNIVFLIPMSIKKVGNRK